MRERQGQGRRRARRAAEELRREFERREYDIRQARIARKIEWKDEKEIYVYIYIYIYTDKRWID